MVATELAGVGGPDLPLEVSAIDSIPEATEAPERALRVVARQQVSLLRIRDGDAVTCELLDRCLAVSRYLLERAGAWLVLDGGSAREPKSTARPRPSSLAWYERGVGVADQVVDRDPAAAADRDADARRRPAPTCH